MSREKRKYAGPTVAEKRNTESRDKSHLSPHKKPRTWLLTVEWTQTTTFQREKSFTSKAARDEARRRIERHFREQEDKISNGQSIERWRGWHLGPFADFWDIEKTTMKTEPEYIETYGEEH